jgi:hypothetical protein
MASTDLKLRAGADGTTARVHSGLLAFHSRVLADAMAATGGIRMAVPPESGMLTLPGKRAPQLQLLVTWLYRCEQLTKVRNAESTAARLAYYCIASDGG